MTRTVQSELEAPLELVDARPGDAMAALPSRRMAPGYSEPGAATAIQFWFRIYASLRLP
jgi:hypothetical protein